ncbi:MAG: GNAT family N-acetyltransferase [Leptospiraceae bacterium]|nr:GNAT family N-acetyltransferase [Leptospiraceae bacterium]
MKAIEESSSIRNFRLNEGNYLARFAQSSIEVEAALRLRYQIFNMELNEGLPESHSTGLDRDIYDEQCEHLLIIHKPTSTVIGTYRMQNYLDAMKGNGLYSAIEFDIGIIPAEILAKTMEVGRACIHAEHRNNRVLFLLWKGLVAYLFYFRLRYLFGCCSLTSKNPNEGAQLMSQFQEDGYVSDQFIVSSRPEFEISDLPSGIPVKTPKLFQAYLNYGAKVCSWPAIDRIFGTIDYLVILDIEKVSEFTKKLFFPPEYR